VKDGIRKVRLARESKARGKDVYAFKVPYRDADGRQTSETFPTMALAKAFRDKRRAAKHEGLSFDLRAGRITFRAYAESWLEGKRAVRRGNTLGQYAPMLGHAYEVIGDRQVGSLRRSDIQAMVTSVSAMPGIGPRTTRHVYGVVRSVIRSAVRDKVIPESPCDGIDLPELPDREAVPLTAAQVRELADSISRPYRAMVLLAAATGLRQGECFGLTVDRIDFLRKTITVDRQMVRGHFGPPKTRASRRTVPVPDFLVPVLAEHVREHAREVTVDGERVRLMFPSRQGRTLISGTFAGYWIPATKAAGLDGTVFHQLRHTCASLLIHQNVSPKRIQKLLGHASITETMDTYGHLYPDGDETARAAIDDAFDDATLTRETGSEADARSGGV
jgi:integrase